MPQQYWQDLTRSLTTGQRQTMLLAELDAEVIGSAYGLFDRHLDGVARLGGMWVAPEVRHRGAGRTLLTAVLAWARKEGYGQMVLWAATGSASAAALYADEGFTATGNIDKIREGSAIGIVEMSRVL
jgi:GNAT superfamily N-acetyltransferase